MSAPVTICGRLGKDPELRFSGNGTAVARLSVVTSGRRKDGDQWVDVDTTWWDVTCFKRLAENVAESLTKGSLVVITGKVRQHNWETPEGEKRSRMEVIADRVAADLTWDPVAVQRADRPAKSPDGAAQAWGPADPPADDPWATPGTDQPPF